MIAIIPIATGQPLDLAPDAEFEIQMEQPLLSDELPAPVSTQISFPPTARNNGVFGFAGLISLKILPLKDLRDFCGETGISPAARAFSPGVREQCNGR